MQVTSKPDVAGLLDRLVAQELPGRRGLGAWRALLRARATLLRQLAADGDARGVLVALTDAGLSRLTETAPVHLRGVSELFVERLDDQELAALETALDKVTLDCNFG